MAQHTTQMTIMEPSHPLSRPLIDWLNSTDKPFVVTTEAGQSDEWLVDPDKKWFIFDGRQMPDWPAAYQALRNIFHLPDYCGDNLNALSECLSDADVLSGTAFVVQIKNASMALNAANADALQGLIQTFENVAEEWAKPICVNEPWDRPAIPFHVILSDVGADPRFARFLVISDSSPPSTPRG